MTNVVEVHEVRAKDKMPPVWGYVSGFIFSVLLTVDAYIMAAFHLFTGQVLVISLIGLALVQLVVQLIFFLHVGQDKQSRWNAVFLLSTISIILILVVGSLWIVYNLNYRMMPVDVPTYLQSQDGF